MLTVLAATAGCRVMEVVGADTVVTSSGSGGGGGSTGAPTSGSTFGGTAGTTLGSGGGTGSSTGASGTGGSGSGGTGGSCGAVDVLFVVEAALGTGPLRTALIDRVPGFVQLLRDTMPAASFHFAVTTTEFGPPPGICSESIANCMLQQTPEEIDARYIRPDDSTTSMAGGQGRLLEYQGVRWIALEPGGATEEASAWIAGAVSALPQGCPLAMIAAAVGWSVHPVNATTNAGFVRDSASLAVIVLSDGLDATPEDLDFLADTVRTAKANCTSCVQLAGAFDTCVVTADGPIWTLMQALDDDPLAVDVDAATFATDLLGPDLAGRIAASCAP